MLLQQQRSNGSSYSFLLTFLVLRRIIHNLVDLLKIFIRLIFQIITKYLQNEWLSVQFKHYTCKTLTNTVSGWKKFKKRHPCILVWTDNLHTLHIDDAIDSVCLYTSCKLYVHAPSLVLCIWWISSATNRGYELQHVELFTMHPFGPKYS